MSKNYIKNFGQWLAENKRTPMGAMLNEAEGSKDIDQKAKEYQEIYKSALDELRSINLGTSGGKPGYMYGSGFMKELADQCDGKILGIKEWKRGVTGTQYTMMCFVDMPMVSYSNKYWYNTNSNSGINEKNCPEYTNIRIGESGYIEGFAGFSLKTKELFELASTAGGELSTAKENIKKIADILIKYNEKNKKSTTVLSKNLITYFNNLAKLSIFKKEASIPVTNQSIKLCSIVNKNDLKNNTKWDMVFHEQKYTDGRNSEITIRDNFGNTTLIKMMLYCATKVHTIEKIASSSNIEDLKYACLVEPIIKGRGTPGAGEVKVDLAKLDMENFATSLGVNYEDFQADVAKKLAKSADKPE